MQTGSKLTVDNGGHMATVSERLYRDAGEQRLLKQRVQREKELYEIEEANTLANMRSDRHINQKTYRTVNEFMND